MQPVRYPIDTNYGVTRCGRVFRITDWLQNGGRYALPHELAQRPNWAGVLAVSTAQGMREVHRMVAETFLPRAEGCDVVAHNDGDNQHNHVDNLRWTTQAGNLSDMDPNKHNTRARGARVGGSKLSEAQVEEARSRVAAGERLGAVAKDYPVDRSVLGRAIKRRTWNHV